MSKWTSQYGIDKKLFNCCKPEGLKHASMHKHKRIMKSKTKIIKNVTKCLI